VTTPVGYFLLNGCDSEPVAGFAWGKFMKEKVLPMKSKRGPEQLMSERWPKLKKRAQHERDPQKLIAILEDIDDLLFNVEMKIAAQSAKRGPKRTERGSVRQSVLSGDSEISSQ
jgi:hypothetical protein